MSGGVPERDIGEGVFYRYVGEKEVAAIEETGLLRGGRRGRTFWTQGVYGSAAEAKARLALGDPPPAYRVAFRIRNDPTVSARADRVDPAAGEPGGGTEWVTTDPVEVEVIEIVELA